MNFLESFVTVDHAWIVLFGYAHDHLFDSKHVGYKGFVFDFLFLTHGIVKVTRQSRDDQHYSIGLSSATHHIFNERIVSRRVDEGNVVVFRLKRSQFSVVRHAGLAFDFLSVERPCEMAVRHAHIG